MPGSHSVVEPPDTMSNSDVKRNSADDSVGFPHVKVGHCQASNESPIRLDGAFFMPGFGSMVHLDVSPVLSLFMPTYPNNNNYPLLCYCCCFITA